MKILQAIQKNYAILGIRSSNQSNQKYPFNIKRVFFGFSLSGSVIASQLVYTYYVANGLMEYMECICSISAAIIIFLCFVAIVVGRTTLFESIDNIENFIEKSKLAFKPF